MFFEQTLYKKEQAKLNLRKELGSGDLAFVYA